ncbi:Phosphoglucomutase, chloroplastic [Coccomyxa sp. Obi]|nr:Phosphoglucomutase, chloroplastic [Coccomyxa sp. Obi]
MLVQSKIGSVVRVPGCKAGGLSFVTSPLQIGKQFGTIKTLAGRPKTVSRGLKGCSSTVLASAVASTQEFTVSTVPTEPIEGQKTGTSGLRKKTKVFMGDKYLANWIQALFNSLGDEVKGKTIGLGGDGRYFNKEAVQTILKIAAAAGVKKVFVGRDAIFATPAMSALIRRRGLYGALIMSASHNPGGPEEDWGIKFNYSSGEPAPERITDAIYGFTKNISELKFADIPETDLSQLGTHTYGGFEVEVIDPVEDYLALLKEVFDFNMLREFIKRPDFSLEFDAMHAVTGAYAGPILVDALGAPASSIRNGTPLEDFGGGHPDPNLTYAHDLVELQWSEQAADLGAASDGDGDRNMILGKKFFITPSDSVAMIAANAQECIPYFKSGLKGVARSMPTSGATDRVAEQLGLKCFEVPTGWKFFGNLMDAGLCSICGEESFGTGADHIREKDGLWAVLAWLSILAYRNKDVPVGGKKVTVEDIAMEHWAKFGRNFFSRYDYEGVESDAANEMVEHLRNVLANSPPGTKLGDYEVQTADEFSYTDPVDGSVVSKQGLRFVFTDGSRIIFRLSGTGSSGATVRLYIEQYSSDVSTHGMDAQEALAPIIKLALEVSQLTKFTGREKPTVIT